MSGGFEIKKFLFSFFLILPFRSNFFVLFCCDQAEPDPDREFPGSERGDGNEPRLQQHQSDRGWSLLAALQLRHPVAGLQQTHPHPSRSDINKLTHIHTGQTSTNLPTSTQVRHQQTYPHPSRSDIIKLTHIQAGQTSSNSPTSTQVRHQQTYPHPHRSDIIKLTHIQAGQKSLWAGAREGVRGYLRKSEITEGRQLSGN